jgi:glycosyltransferase involved in cell wall biosynthesis
MKIAFIGQKGIPAVGGGVERYVEDLAVRLATAGHEVIVYTRSHYTPKSLKNYQGVRLVYLPTLHTKHLDTIIHSTLSCLHAIITGADVAHFQTIGPALVCWLPKLLRPKMKVVSTLQSFDYEHQKWGHFAKLMLKLGERLMCRFSDEVIVVTKAMEQYVRDKYGINGRYIPNGANVYEPAGADLISKWGLAKDNYIVAVSRLVRHKGLHYLIAAYQKLNTNKKLVIVGDGAFTDSYIKELKDLVRNNANIIFTGNQTGATLAQLYANAYLFVQPSESEGLSLALLEAMARGVAVLVSDITANREAVGDAGFMFISKDTAYLLHQLRVLLSDAALVKAQGEAGRARVAEKFNWDKITKEVIKVYEQPTKQAEAMAGQAA